MSFYEKYKLDLLYTLWRCKGLKRKCFPLCLTALDPTEYMQAIQQPYSVLITSMQKVFPSEELAPTQKSGY